MPGIRRAVKQADRQNLGAAVHRHRAMSRRGLQERVFPRAFQRLVSPQIWEDPNVDLGALRPEETEMRTLAARRGLTLQFTKLYGRYANLEFFTGFNPRDASKFTEFWRPYERVRAAP